VDDALGWLDAERPSRFFVWVPLYDPHGPQSLPDDYRARYGGDLYAGAIAFMDAQIARLLNRLDLDRTAVIIVGDHGESLGDHGELEHGIFLYEAALHVPLIVRAPQLEPRRVSSLASLVDIVPTVLGLMELPAPPTDGVSFLPAVTGRGAIPERSLYAESMYARRFGWSPPRMLRDGRFKLIDLPRPELYDLDADPFESHDLSTERPSLVRGMRLQLDRITSSARRDITPARPADIAALASLGYVSGTPASLSVDGLDPKDFIERYNETTRRRALR
jgi:arylsulfatase A-like enzyme